MRFFYGFFLGLVTGVFYGAAALFATTASCGNSPFLYNFLSRWPFYIAHPLAALDAFLVKQPFLGVPSFATFDVGGFMVTIAMVNTALLIGVIGGILAMLQQDWHWRRIMGFALLFFVMISFVLYMATFSGCAFIKAFLGDSVRVFACEPPPPFWRW